MVNIRHDITDSQRVAEVPPAAHGEFERVFDFVPDLLCIAGVDGRFRRVNRAFCNTLGYTAEELTAVPFAMFVHPDDRQATAREMAAIAGGTATLAFENRYRHQDGTYRLLSWRTTSPGPDGLLYAAARDITAHRQAHEDLRASEERHRTILETAMDGFWLTDMEGRLQQVNQAYCNMSGYSRQELLSMRIADLEALETEEAVTAHLRLLRERGWTRFQSKHRHKDGHVFDVEISAQYRPEEGGRSVAFLRDITEHKQSERALRESEARFRDVAMAHAGILYEVNAEFVTTHISGRVREILGYGPDEILGRNPAFVIDTEDGERIGKLIRGILTTGAPVRDLEYWCRHKDGRRVRISSNALPFFAPEGGLLGFRGSHLDVTERYWSRHRREVLLKIQEMRNEPDEVISAVLCEACALQADSPMGFFGMIEPDGAAMIAHVWSPGAMADCSVPEKPLRFSLKGAGLWADPIRRREPIIVNDYSSAPGRGGVPEGHVPISRYMGVPVVWDQRVIAVVGVANKAVQYEKNDMARVGLLAASAADFLATRRAEREMRHNEYLFRTFVDFTADWECWCMPDGSHIYDSPSCEAITGYTAAEFVADPKLVARIVHPEDGELFAAHRCLAGETSCGDLSLEFRILRRDGEVRWIQHVCRPVFAEDRTVTGRRISNRDITLQKHQEAEIRLQALVLDQIHDQVIVTDTAGTITFVNQAQVRALGRPKEDFLGRSIVMLGEDSAKGAIQREILEATLRDGSWQGEVVNFAADGSARHLLCRTDAVRDASGAPVALCGIATDITERKRAEEALQKSEASLLEAERVAHVGHWTWDFGSSRVSWSDEMKRIFGLDPADYGGDLEKVIAHSIHPDDRAAVRHANEAVWHGGGPEPLEYRVVRPDGSVRVVLATPGERVANDDGRILRLSGVVLDITDMRRAEEALRRSETLHRDLLQAMPDVVMRFDREGRHLYVSDNVGEVAGIPAPAFLGRTHRDLGFPSELCEFWEDTIQRAFDLGQRVETEFVFAGVSGDMAFNWRLVPERDSDGQVRSVLSISRDVTAHRKAERDYQTLVREMPSGIALHEMLFDDQGRAVDYRFLAVNPAFERMTGLHADDVVGKRVRELIPGLEPRWIETYARVVATGEPTHLTDYSQDLDRHYSVTAFRPAPGQFVCVIDDITQSKRVEAERADLEARLTQAQKMESIGRLAGGIAHDFNNQLTVIMGLVEMVLQGMPPDNPIVSDLHDVLKASERSAALTKQLLAFARKQVISPKVILLDETIEGLLKMIRRLIGEDIELAWQPGCSLWRVNMDPSQIDQVLVNLCVNARDAIAGVGRITIETANVSVGLDQCLRNQDAIEGDYVRLSVTDTGCGMNEETLALIFEPFFTTKGLARGTGLGLATVYGIVRQNTGFVEVRSMVGTGSTFEVYIPRHFGEGGAASPTEATAPAPRGRETLLFVEDEPSLLALSERHLRYLGYTVLSAATPEAALALGLKHGTEIRLLVTDVIMPGMTGQELATRLLSQFPELRCLFVSGYTADILDRRGLLPPGMHLLTKPYKVRDLAAKVRQILEA